MNTPAPNNPAPKNPAGNDPLGSALQPLLEQEWRHPGHQAALLAALERGARAPRRRWPQLAAAALLGALVTATLTAAGWPWLRALFEVEVIDVQRDADGDIAGLTLRDGRGRVMLLRPVPDAADAVGAPGAGADAEPTVVAVPLAGGGTVRLRVHRGGRLGLRPSFVAIGPAGDPERGARYRLEQSDPGQFEATWTEERLVIHRRGPAGAAQRFVLAAVPDRARCYSDGEALLEVLAP